MVILTYLLFYSSNLPKDSITVEDRFLEWTDFLKTIRHSGFLHLLQLESETDPVNPKMVQQEFISNLTIYSRGTVEREMGW